MGIKFQPSSIGLVLPIRIVKVKAYMYFYSLSLCGLRSRVKVRWLFWVVKVLAESNQVISLYAFLKAVYCTMRVLILSSLSSARYCSHWEGDQSSFPKNWRKVPVRKASLARGCSFVIGGSPSSFLGEGSWLSEAALLQAVSSKKLLRIKGKKYFFIECKNKD